MKKIKEVKQKKKMKKTKKIEKKMAEIGQILGINKADVKMTLRHRRNPLIMGIIIIAAAITFGNLDMLLGKRYAAISPLDFVFFDKFPFSFLF